MEFEQIGKYKIIGKIGQGAMGEVWKAHDPVLNRHVAIKTISAGLGADDTLRKRFQREAQSAARLNHPNVITVYDFGEEKGLIYMAMELLEGTDLKEVIGSRVLNEIHDKLDVMEQICDGLAYAHSHDVVHRDLKPGNIHIQPGGQVKIMDFGLARLGSSDMTREGMILGTPNYMSPEQVRGEKADARSDIFSLGAVFYELLTNRKPFDADSLHAVLFNVLQQEPEPVRKWAPDLPQALVDIVEKALCKDPNERFQTTAELREALRSVRQALAEGWVGEPTMAVESLVPGDDPFEPAPEAPAPEPVASRSRASRGLSPARVEGSAALDPARATERKVSSGSSMRARRSTLSGRALTASGRTVAAPPPEAPSRWPLYVGGVVVLAGVGILAFVLLRPAPDVAPTPGVPGAQVNALTQALVGSQLELARRNFQDKDFKGALAQAESALKLDPSSADAQEIRDKARATLAELDAAADEARSAFDAGDTERASRALAKVLSIDPRHPVAAQLSKQLNSRFRGQADEARKSMARSRTAAEHARAVAADGIVDAAALAREGEGLLDKNDFTVATQKFLAARDAFERARRAAEDRAAARTPPPTMAATTTLPPVTAPPMTAAPVTAPPVTAPPVTLAPATVPPMTAPPATTAVVSDDPAIRQVVADYGHAIESRDLALFRALKPNLSADEERRLQEAFQGIHSQRVEINVLSVKIDGSQATVRLARRDTINGSPVTAFQQTLLLVKGPGGWTIRDIGR